MQVVPAPADAVTVLPWGRRVELRAPQVPGAGHRVLCDPGHVRRVVADLAPDRLEVHDRTAPRGLGRWARREGVPSLVAGHRRLDPLLRQWLSARLPLDLLADRANTAFAEAFDQVVCTSAWAETEFRRLGVANLRRVRPGVDLDRFRPDSRSAGFDGLLLVMLGRLSQDKRPDLALRAAGELVRRGHRVRLVFAGDGPLRRTVRAAAVGAQVDLPGPVLDRDRVAELLAAADVVLAPGPADTTGVAALEALACGTPVVANVHSALPEILGAAGHCSASTPRCFADAVEQVLALDPVHRRATARSRAEQLPWAATVEGFLRAHALPLGPGAVVGAAMHA